MLIRHTLSLVLAILWLWPPILHAQSEALLGPTSVELRRIERKPTSRKSPAVARPWVSSCTTAPVSPWTFRLETPKSAKPA